MAEQGALRLLTVNTGSSSLKAGLYRCDGGGETLEWAASAERIGGGGGGRLRVSDARGATLLDEAGGAPSHGAALRALFAWQGRRAPGTQPDAAGHRIVHGGAEFVEPQRVTAALLRTVEALVPLDPDHLPQALEAIRTVTEACPAIPQAACFDTAFHRDMPRVARMYALPRRLWDAGVRRYGFHGLSYEYVMRALRAEDPAAAGGRVVIAHLGNGASMAAVRDGKPVDTTMGFTPTGGLVMGTRCGDLDPGVLLHLLDAERLDGTALSRLVNREAGLLGVSGHSGDMRDLLAREGEDPRAADAVLLFCYQARKFAGALAAALGGLDALVFTGGIGEHAASVRERICTGLEHLGVRVSPGLNAAHAPVISPPGSPVTVRIVKTDEDRMIARHTFRVVAEGR